MDGTQLLWCILRELALQRAPVARNGATRRRRHKFEARVDALIDDGPVAISVRGTATTRGTTIVALRTTVGTA